MKIALIIIGIILIVVSLILLSINFFGTKTIRSLKEKENILKEKITQNQQRIDEQVGNILTMENQINKNFDYNKDLENQINDNKEQVQKLNTNKEVLKKEVKFLQDQINSFDESVDKAKELSQLKLEEINKNFDNNYNIIADSYNSRIEELEGILLDLREKRNAAVQQAIKDYEEDNKKAFYMLQISKEDLSDIRLLKQIEDRITKKEVVGKIIYKVYIEKYYTDLVGRVLNKEDFSGIYKITNQVNQMCYVGQAASIKKRWLQHIKRAIGAEPLINNKLYPAMQEFGIENFSFEVIDRCDRDKLNEREQYWQQFYLSKSFGYSIK